MSNPYSEQAAAIQTNQRNKIHTTQKVKHHSLSLIIIQPCSFKALQGFFLIQLFTARHAELVSASHSPCTLPTPKGLNTNSPESQLGATHQPILRTALKSWVRKMQAHAKAKNKTLFERSEFVLLRVAAAFFNTSFHSLVSVQPRWFFLFQDKKNKGLSIYILPTPKGLNTNSPESQLGATRSIAPTRLSNLLTAKTNKPSHQTLHSTHPLVAASALKLRASHLTILPSHLTLRASCRILLASHLTIGPFHLTILASCLTNRASHLTVLPSGLTVRASHLTIVASGLTIGASHLTVRASGPILFASGSIV